MSHTFSDYVIAHRLSELILLRKEERERERKWSHRRVRDIGDFDKTTKRTQKGFKENIRQNAHFLPVREKRVF